MKKSTHPMLLKLTTFMGRSSAFAATSLLIIWRTHGEASTVALGVAVALTGCGSRTELQPARTESVVVERCNGVDDDLDGFVDEGIGSVSCGVGACQRQVPGCVAGAPPSCAPGPAATEVCNGVDDDCDGAVDEELGFDALERITVRSFEGSTGNCTSCNGTSGVQLWRTSEGFLAVWTLGFQGTEPQPNAFARRLNSDGTPQGQPFVLFDTNVTDGFRIAPLDGTQAALAFCGRFGNDDVMASSLIDSQGTVLVDPQPIEPLALGCGALHPDGVWSGERLLFSWTNNSSVDDDWVLLNVSQPSGTSELGRFLIEPGDLAVPSRFAVGHGRVAMVTGFRPEPRMSLLRFFLFDPFGAELFAADLPPLPKTVWRGAVVAPAPEGWLIIGIGGSTGALQNQLMKIRLDPDGALLEGPILLQPGEQWGSIEIEATLAGEFLLAGSRSDATGLASVAVMRLDNLGQPTDVWQPSPAQAIGRGGLDILSDDGDMWLIHNTRSRDHEANEVVLWKLGCG